MSTATSPPPVASSPAKRRRLRYFGVGGGLLIVGFVVALQVWQPEQACACGYAYWKAAG